MSLDPSLGAPKLLIVDDSRVSRILIRTFFTKQCPTWQILDVGSGNEAVAMAQESKPDFVTMDIGMPGINGFDASKQMLAVLPSVRIVILSANVQESSRMQAEGLRLDFVAKPATEASLQQILKLFAPS